MNQLIIKLTGTVNSSNFEEWKNDLISQVQATNIELFTDDDFVVASKQVKSFKSAEISLKQAKQSAIDQAQEIQQLFSAIDEITEEARQTRLSLERQIKARKLEIKNQCIQSGIDEIQAFIDQQANEITYIDKETFLKRSRFELAVSGKAGIKGMQNAMGNLCGAIKSEVSDRALEIKNNKKKIDDLDEDYKLLFQDWETLLILPESELNLVIEIRTAKYQAKKSRKEAEKKTNELNSIEDLELNPEKISVCEVKSAQQEKYQIRIQLLSTKDKAIELARVIKDSFGNDQSVDEIKLIRNRDD